MSDTLPEHLIEDVGFRLHRAASLSDRLIDAYLRREWQISAAQFWVLLAVAMLDRPSYRQISAELGVSRSTVADRVRHIASDGLIAIHPNPNSGSRAQVIVLTEFGARRLAAAWQGLNAHQTALLIGIDERSLVRQLGLVVDNTEAFLHRHLAIEAVSPSPSPDRFTAAAPPPSVPAVATAPRG